MARVVIVGCGVVGAMLAYELGQSGLEVCVLDQQSPAQGSTGAALGVLMGIISHKVKGRSWRLRETSLHRYETLIPELEERLGRKLAFNRQGVLNLCFDAAELPRWQSLQQIRQTQGYTLEIWTPAQVAKACPHLALGNVAAGIYSPQDRQIDPTALTLALVEAAQQQGVHFQWDHSVTGIDSLPSGGVAVHTPQKTLEADSAILAAGIGTTTLTQQLNQPIEISPVLGQALRLQLPAPLGNPQFQPVINGNDVHLVHLGQGSYWVGATVEFPAETDPQWLLVEQRQQELLDAVL
ncbi:MAG TPA: FAD-dependent oxidoreductase, partial [Trichocoleus sp.]